MPRISPTWRADRFNEVLAQLGWDDNRLIVEIAKKANRAPSPNMIKGWRRLVKPTYPAFYGPIIAEVTGTPLDYFTSQPVN